MTVRSGADHEARDGDGLTKVTFRLERSDWHDHATESLWAEPAGRDRYRLRNVPFYAYGASYDDVVEARADDDRLMVEEVAQHSGHSTYRLFVTNTKALALFADYWRSLDRLGCTLERATERLFAMDVPPTADIYAVYDALSRGEAAGVWDFEEAHVGHALKEQPH